MTCKDCIYYEMCVIVENDAEKDERDYYTEYGCPYFKDKADFVEVVRCKNCKHYGEGRCGKILYIMDGYYKGGFETKKPTDFCSYGERIE